MKRLLMLKEDQLYYQNKNKRRITFIPLCKPIRGTIVEYLWIDYRISASNSPIVVSVLFSATRLREIYTLSMQMIYSPPKLAYWNKHVVLAPKELQDV